MNHLSLCSFLLIVMISNPFYGNAQFDNATSVVCQDCPFTQLLVEWDMLPGADELVQSGDSLYYRSNDGMGGFGALQFVTMLPSGEQLVLFEDADDDTDYDLFTHNNGTVHLLRDDGGIYETILLDTALSFNTSVAPYDHPDGYGAVRAMHVDDDGMMDLAKRRNNGNTFTWYRNDGSGGYEKRIDTIPNDVFQDSEIVAMDWDNDGFNDLITTTTDQYGVAIYQNNGSWNTTFDTITPPLFGIGPGLWDVVDLNGDGVLDLLNSQHMFISEPDSVHFLRDWPVDHNYYNYRRILDLDCDDLPELFGQQINVGLAQFAVYEIENDSLHVTQYPQVDPTVISMLELALADLNADGAPDLLFQESFTPSQIFYARYNLAALPEVTLNLPFNEVTIGTNYFLSGGLPLGGTWSGNDVTGDSLLTDQTPVLPIAITYTFTSEQGCTDSAMVTIDFITGVPTADAGTGLVAYPNPGGDQIQFIGLSTSPLDIAIYDLRGVLVQTQSKLQSGQRLDVHGFAPGMYTIQLRDLDGKLNRLRWVKQ